MHVWGCSVSFAGSGSLSPPLQMTNFLRGHRMHWTGGPFSPRVLCQRWSLPPSVHTEDLATMTAATTRSCPSSCGGAEVCSHISPGTLNASTVPHRPAWSRATARYRRRMNLEKCFLMKLLAQTESRCSLTLIIITMSSCFPTASNPEFDLERSSCTNGPHPSSFTEQTSGRMRRHSLVSATRPGPCSTRSRP